jgi:hypothetical protein
MSLFHFAAATLWPEAPFTEREVCARFWARLRSRFKKVLGCTLMPDHLHLLVEFASAEALRRLMAVELSSFARSLGRGPLWQPISLPTSIPNLQHLRRQIRYVNLNPCRAKIVDDPLKWEWSTHRDVIGATRGDWMDWETLGRAFGYSSESFARRFHEYVSADPDVEVEGTELPERIEAGQLVASFSSIEWAVLQSTRVSARDLRMSTPERRLLLLAAGRLGGASRERMSEWVGIRPRAIQDALRAPVSAVEERALKRVFWLLSDRRRFGG